MSVLNELLRGPKDERREHCELVDPCDLAAHHLRSPVLARLIMSCDRGAARAPRLDV